MVIAQASEEPAAVGVAGGSGGGSTLSPMRAKAARAISTAGIGCGAFMGACLITLAAFMATPLGGVVAVGFAALMLASTVACYLPSHPWTQPLNWLFPVSLIAFGLAFSAVGLGPDPVRLTMLAVVVVLMAVLLVRWHKRFAGPRWELPAPSRLVGVLALAAGLLLGIGAGLFACLDERPETFPHLQQPRPVVPDDQNAFVVLQELAQRFPVTEHDRCELDERWEWWMYEGKEGTPEWREEGRRLVREWEPRLEYVDRMLACPHFLVPLADSAVEHLETHPWQSYSRWPRRMLALKSSFLLHQGAPDEAMAVALKLVKLGRMVCSQPNDVMTYLIGWGILAHGYDQVRAVATSEDVDLAFVRGYLDRLTVPPELRSGAVVALAGEFSAARLMFENPFGLGTAAWDDPDVRRLSRMLCALVRRPLLPLIKPNMSLNRLGRRLEAQIARLDDYDPREPAEFDDLADLAKKTGYVSFIRNSVGVVLTEMCGPSDRSVVRGYWHQVADARMTRVFLALRCYHLEHGRMPASLDDLAPEYLEEVPVDPFAEQPFVYEPQADPPCILSVGPDQARDAPDAEEGDDIAVELTFAAPRDRETR